MYSSTSQSSNTTISVPYEQVKCSSCWRVADLVASKSEDNPGRLYYRCVGCAKFLRWWQDGRTGKEKARWSGDKMQKQPAPTIMDEADYGFLIGEIIQLKEEVAKLKAFSKAKKEDNKKLIKEMVELRKQFNEFQSKVFVRMFMIVFGFLVLLMYVRFRRVQ